MKEIKQSWNDLMDRNEKIYIFGTGVVGQRLLDLIGSAGYTDSFKGFIVSDDRNERMTYGEYPVFSFKDVSEKDALVLVSVSDKYHKDLYDMLKMNGYTNYVNAIEFFMIEGYEKREEDSMEDIVDTSIVLEANEIKARDEIVAFFKKCDLPFDSGKPYQSFPRLGIIGERDTEKRIEMYRLFDYIDEHTELLDIGCNYGFLDMALSSRIKGITALDFSDEMISMAQKVSELLNISNIVFASGDYNEFQKSIPDHSYDAVFSFAVHIWLNISPEEYAAQLFRILRNKGFVFFESQTYLSDSKYGEFCLAIEKKGLEKVFSVLLCDDGKTERKMTVFRKGN